MAFDILGKVSTMDASRSGGVVFLSTITIEIVGNRPALMGEIRRTDLDNRSKHESGAFASQRNESEY